MNAVELDVGNLNQWLMANPALVDYSGQNGYLVFFSDRRGMLADPNAGNITTGEYGFEDVINSTSATGTPDGVSRTESAPTGFSPEDVDENRITGPLGRRQCWQWFEGIDSSDQYGKQSLPGCRLPELEADKISLPAHATSYDWWTATSGTCPCVLITGSAALQLLRKIPFTSWETTTPTWAIPGGEILFRRHPTSITLPPPSSPIQ